MLPAEYSAGDVEDVGRRDDVDLHRSSVRSSRAIESFGVLTLRLRSRGLDCRALSHPHTRMSAGSNLYCARIRHENCLKSHGAS